MQNVTESPTEIFIQPQLRKLLVVQGCFRIYTVCPRKKFTNVEISLLLNFLRKAILYKKIYLLRR